VLTAHIRIHAKLQIKCIVGYSRTIMLFSVTLAGGGPVGPGVF
jgi:hypothetical protein